MFNVVGVVNVSPVHAVDLNELTLRGYIISLVQGRVFQLTGTVRISSI